MPIRLVFLCLGLMSAAAGCAKVKAAVCADMVPAPKPAAAGAKTPDGAGPDGKPAKPATSKPESGGSAETLTSGAHPVGPAQEQFALPFAWEKSPEEPLSKTRAYLRDIARDNAAYMRHGPEFFKALAKGESPRATVLSCADSRVQPGALDATPENDAFQVRNLGNQLEPGLGSIQYGVEELKTPLLIILGHTGCSAIRAALTGTDKLSDPIKRELGSLHFTKKKPKKLDDSFFAEAVVDNLNAQVERALKVFTPRVNSGQLTIIAAVYDARNDFGKGAGKVTIVNVNGITEASRLKAFHDAVLAGANLDAAGNPKHVDPFERLSQMFAEHMHDGEGDEDEPQKPPQTAAPAVDAKPPAATPPAAKPAPAAEPGTFTPRGGAAAPPPATVPAAKAKPRR